MDHPKRNGLRDVRTFVRPRLSSLMVTLLLGVASTAAALAQPLAVGRVLGAVAAGRPVVGPVGLLILLFGADAILSAFQRYLLGRVGEGAVLELRKTLVGRLLRLPIAFHDRSRNGDLLSRVGADATLLGATLTSSVASIASGVMMFSGAMVLMAIIDLPLLAVTLVCVAAATACVILVSSSVRVASEGAQESVGLLSVAVDRALAAMRTVKLSVAEEREERVISEKAEGAYLAGLRVLRLQALVEPVATVALQGCFVFVLGIGGARLASGAVELSELVTFLLYLFYLAGPLAIVFASVADLQKGLAAFGRIEDTLAVPMEPRRPGPAPSVRPESSPPAGTPLVSFDSVTFGYSRERRVLNGVSFEIPERTRTALVGPSGAGKSSVFALLARLYEPDSGSIFFEGEEAGSLSPSALRAKIGYVEQDSPVMAGSILSNLLYANPGATEGEIDEVLDLTNLHPLVERLPRGLETEVGDYGVMLSGGERQRIALARSLLARPRLLLLDEATSQLDAENERMLRESLGEISRTCTVVTIAHRLSTVLDADEIVVLADGRIRATGTHNELLATDGLYRKLAKTQLLDAHGGDHLDALGAR